VFHIPNRVRLPRKQFPKQREFPVVLRDYPAVPLRLGDVNRATQFCRPLIAP
jgi:hypothetical protein